MVDHKVGIGKINYGKLPDTLTTKALGSCVGVVLFDPYVKVAGMAHIVLPSSNGIGKKMAEISIIHPGKFANLAIPSCIKRLKNMGAKNIKAKIAGGSEANKTQTNHNNNLTGKKNVKAVIQLLQLNNIPIVGKDVEGRWSRTITFFTDNEILRVKKTSIRFDRILYKIEMIHI